MRLVTYRRNADEPRLGAMLRDDAVVDLARASGGALPAAMMPFLAGGRHAMQLARTVLASADAAARGGASATGTVLALRDVVLCAPVPRPGKVLAIGLNYRDHAEESGQAIPEHPVVFSKMATCIVGNDSPIHRPKVSGSVDWEGELCVVIGMKGRHISAADALSHVAGYMNGNDVSVRDWQFHAATWTMGKGFDTHGPTGPWLVTQDEVADVADLDVRTYVNDELVQSSNTRHLIFDVPTIIEYLSTAFTLEPGDVIFTGTPAGVGMARKPQRWLSAGDVVRVEISGLGVLENRVIDEP